MNRLRWACIIIAIAIVVTAVLWYFHWLILPDAAFLAPAVTATGVTLTLTIAVLMKRADLADAQRADLRKAANSFISAGEIVVHRLREADAVQPTINRKLAEATVRFEDAKRQYAAALQQVRAFSLDPETDLLVKSIATSVASGDDLTEDSQKLRRRLRSRG